MLCDDVSMPDFSWWGSLTSIAGIFVSFFGLAWAIRRAGKAQSAALAAATAATEARSEITDVLYFRELERAIGIIERLKSWHRDSKWDLTIEQYSILRAALASLNEHHLPNNPKLGESLQSAIVQVRVIEELVEKAILGSVNNQSGHRKNKFSANQDPNSITDRSFWGKAIAV